ncbi:hypothetical protein GA0070607_2309 [Micromonospora coriariae]|uniref:Uncharacterized protein n=1 Tax=Micromonospora coriariae TaxID=285665 RepID=A0A1C4VLF3_9ACTN|nr:hypothetical protein [Micromonospora coriariae]SCE84778.1 hypothetical protein GA0070607_2309 [Micromonospora coriariae]
MIRGTLIAESLRPSTDLRVAGLNIVRVRRQDVSDSASDTQPKVWTLLDFEAANAAADEIGRALAGSLATDGGWYADFTIGDDRVVVFPNQVFRYRRGDRAGRAEAVEHGKSVGVPEHQLDWGD